MYSFMGLLDKAVAGLAVLFIQEYYPESPPEGYVINSHICYEVYFCGMNMA